MKFCLSFKLRILKNLWQLIQSRQRTNVSEYINTCKLDRNDSKVLRTKILRIPLK